jgi:putative hydrolase of the HAD superfamily
VAGLKTVLFDVDDTLFSTTAFARRARANAVRAMIAAGLDASEEEVLRELDEVIAEFSSNYEHHFDRLIQRLRPDGLPGRNQALVVAAGVTAYHDTKFRGLEPYEDVRPLLTALRDAGVQTGVVTHGWTTKQAEKLVRLGLVDLLDTSAVFISDQLGISKPNPKLYLTVLRALDRRPEEVMYVGDNLLHDIAPPQSLGMVAVWARRGARQREQAGVVPDHTVDDFEELLAVLRESYGLDV